MKMVTTFIIIIMGIILFSENSHAQNTSTLKSITIDRIEVNKEFSSTHDIFGSAPSSNMVYTLGLEVSTYKGIYDYWKMKNGHIGYEQTLADKSKMSTYSSDLCSVSISLKGQELVLAFKNNSRYWLSFDISDLHYNISYFDSNNNMIDTPSNLQQYTMGTLFSYHRGEYGNVFLSPGASVTCPFFRIDGFRNGYDIIHSSIRDGSRLDMAVKMNVYSSDPVTSNIRFMTEARPHAYSQQSPVQHLINYKGVTFKDGDAIYVSDDNIRHVDNPSLRVGFRIIGKIGTNRGSVVTHKNSSGLQVYGLPSK